MPRNASGTYSLPSGNPVEAGTVIEATWANTTLEDIGNELTNSLSRTGEGGMLAPFRLADGTLGAPGIAWLNEPSTGFYRAGAGEMWGVAQGSRVLQYTSNGVLVPTGKTFTAQGNVTIGGTLAITGAVTFSGALDVAGNFAVATNKFTVAAASGNTAVAGTLGVSGAATLSSTLGVTGAATLGSTLAVTGAITATGGVTGNVTGNVIGDVSGNAGTVTNGVYTTGDQTIGGTKTFSSTISGSVSGNAGTVTNGVYTTGNQTIAGVKTFSSTISGNIDGNAGTVTNGVYTTGSYADPSWITSIAGSKVSGNISGNAATATTATNLSGGSVSATTGTFSSTLSATGDTTLAGNLTLSGTAKRILGDFSSNATVANRVMFQTSTSNGATLVSAIPNGTGNTSRWLAYNGSDPANANAAVLSAISTDIRLASVANGTASALPMTFYMGTTLAATVDTSANWAFANNPTLSAGTANGVLYLNGSKVATSGSALVYDGSIFYVNGAGGTRVCDAASANGFEVVPGSTNNILSYNRTSATYLDVRWRAGNQIWEVANTEGMRLTSTGLGIGTSSSYSKLYVKQGADGTPTQGIVLEASANDNRLTQYYSATNNEWVIAATYGSTGAFKPLTWWTSDTKRMTLDSSGNLGLGVTPSAWGSATRAYEGVFGSMYSFITDRVQGGISTNARSTATPSSGDTWAYRYTGYGAGRYAIDQTTHAWYTAPSGTAGNAITFTQAMTLDASGNLGVGIASPGQRLHVELSQNASTWTKTSNGNSGSGAAAGVLLGTDQGDAGALSQNSSGNTSPAANALRLRNLLNAPITFETNGSERARIDSSGNLLVGTNSNPTGWRFVVANADSTDNTYTAVFTLANGTGTHYFFNATGTGVNTTQSAMWIQKNSTSSRSINAAGTINASGADYAEYMTKAGDFTLAKGDVCGIDANGELTNVFADAVSFVVKSTNPSYVGGDSWGAEFKDDPDGLESARQQVDRIAFAGQVPVNVMGATPGQYIVPVNDKGAIKGQAVSNPTFEQYQIAVGKVIALEADGRARIIVKVA